MFTQNLFLAVLTTVILPYTYVYVLGKITRYKRPKGSTRA